jgi:AcrR family transcriptional regulator
MLRIHNSHPKKPRTLAQRARASARKQPIQSRSKHMVAMLMRATARILIRDGYDALTTNRVAEEAGASVGSLYQYFPSKEALVAALLQEHLDSITAQMRMEAARVATLPVERAVRRFIELMFELHRVDPELHRVFAEQLPRVGDFAKIEALMDEHVALMQAYLEAHADEITPQNHALTAFILVSTVEALTHRAVILRPQRHNDAELVDEICQLVIRYLAPRKSKSKR